MGASAVSKPDDSTSIDLHRLKSTLVETLLNLVKRTSTTLPGDVAAELGRHRGGFVVDTIVKNVAVAKEDDVPLCQDTGTLTFWFEVPDGTPHAPLIAATREAVRLATEQGYLRQNTVLEPGSVAREDNLSETHPVIHFVGASSSVRPGAHLRKPLRGTVRLLMKGGGSENVSRQYSLPDTELGAGRSLEGVRRCVLDAALCAQGNGCAPGILGVCIGGDRATGFEAAKEQLLRRLDDTSENPEIAALETRLLDDINALGIGPMGMGGAPTALGVKIACASRLPASYFVTVAYMCWCCRRATTLM